MHPLKDKIALVTGGGTGIGRAIVERLLALGANVVVTGRRQEPLDALAKVHGDRLATVVADVTRPGDAKRAVAAAVTRFGRLDVLVNSAGVYLAKPLVETSDEEIQQVFGTNVHGLLAMSREAIAELARTGGSIVNVSSTVSNAALPAHSVYSGTKAAVDHITRSLAAELGPQGIRVNAVAPGLTETDMTSGMPDAQRDGMVGMTALGRIGQPKDIAAVVAFLAGPDAAWVTGQVVGASGGLLI